MPRRLYPGAGDELTTAYDVTSPDPVNYDLSTATGARLKFFFDDDKDSVEIAANILPVPPAVVLEANQIRLARVHQTTDIPEGKEGTARIEARIDLPAYTNPVRAEAKPVPVGREGT